MSKFCCVFIGIKWGAAIPLERTVHGRRTPRADLPPDMYVYDIASPTAEDAIMRAAISCAAEHGHQFIDSTAILVLDDKQQRALKRLPPEQQMRRVLQMLGTGRRQKPNPRRRRR